LLGKGGFSGDFRPCEDERPRELRVIPREKKKNFLEEIGRTTYLEELLNLKAKKEKAAPLTRGRLTMTSAEKKLGRDAFKEG